MQRKWFPKLLKSYTECMAQGTHLSTSLLKLLYRLEHILVQAPLLSIEYACSTSYKTEIPFTSGSPHISQCFEILKLIGLCCGHCKCNGTSHFFKIRYNYRNSGQHPTSCLLLKARRFGNWILSAPWGGTYWIGPERLALSTGPNRMMNIVQNCDSYTSINIPSSQNYRFCLH
jgi:hypothetical protein